MAVGTTVDPASLGLFVTPDPDAVAAPRFCAAGAIDVFGNEGRMEVEARCLAAAGIFLFWESALSVPFLEGSGLGKSVGGGRGAIAMGCCLCCQGKDALEAAVAVVDAVEGLEPAEAAGIPRIAEGPVAAAVPGFFFSTTAADPTEDLVEEVPALLVVFVVDG